MRRTRGKQRMAAGLYVKKTLLDAGQIRRMVRRMAGELVERNEGVEDLLLVGIRTRGVPLAERLAEEVEAMEGRPLPLGVLDITLYRDDLSTIAPQPVVKESHFPVPVEGKTVVLCDDVLYTGRTVRAALDALLDYGRPRAVQLAVLVDRGWRELPIQADLVGLALGTSASEVIKVAFAPTDDGEEAVKLLDRGAGG
ncbi:MAG TPA: bifunctional pyr operon transcriptional regulator/uracil phosphoribosyltransferase PyrR [Thermoanaerobaculia bacterium]|nr:bifunctional pyr operon transcriptional regulator/uracil phosphoribosyltransferase PyrR [Thermoanaerobaculia bacterium]